MTVVLCGDGSVPASHELGKTCCPNELGKTRSPNEPGRGTRSSRVRWPSCDGSTGLWHPGGRAASWLAVTTVASVVGTREVPTCSTTSLEGCWEKGTCVYMCACMCMCVGACVWWCVHVCMLMHVRVHPCAGVYKCMHVYTCLHVYG